MDESLIKRVMPHSPEAEQSVIGSMIMDTDAILTASEIITSDDFYQKQYGVLFDTMVELYQRFAGYILYLYQRAALCEYRARQSDAAPSDSRK